MTIIFSVVTGLCQQVCKQSQKSVKRSYFLLWFGLPIVAISIYKFPDDFTTGSFSSVTPVDTRSTETNSNPTIPVALPGEI